MTAISDANDIQDLAGLALNVSALPTVLNSIAWDVTVPTIDDIFSVDSDNNGDVNSLDVTFSENILESSLTAGDFELDDDNTNSGSGEVTATTIATAVTYPSVVNVSNDEYINVSGASEVTGSENVFLHIIAQGTRDVYGN